jgi:hypothetical protein
MKTKISAFFITLACVFAMVSCQSKNSGETKAMAANSESAESLNIKEEIIKIVNTLPTSTETVNLVNATGAAYLAGFTGEDMKTENLLTRAEKAKAYGTVIFDLAYTHIYNQVESFSKLLKVYESLTKELGFEDLVRTQRQFKERYQKSKDNKDSVDFLVTDMLNKTNDIIQRSGSSVDISLVFAGAVVKSLNVISYLTLFATSKDKLIAVLQKQKELINATCNILKKASTDEMVGKFYQTLVPICDIYNSTLSFSIETVDKINKLTGSTSL